MIGIPIYQKNEEDFSTNGMGLLLPIECTIEESAAGMYELTLIQPIDHTLRWAQIQNGRIIKAPCPVRESPLYEGDISTETVVLREVYRVTGTSVGVRLRVGPGTGYKRISTHKNDTMVVKLGDAENGYMHVCLVKGGAVGYMSKQYLTFDHNESETVTPEMPETQNVVQLEPARNQLFRIYSVETDTDAGVVTAKAMHIFYDIRGNLIAADYQPEKKAAADVVNDIETNLLEPSEIHFKAIRLTGSISGDYSFKSPVEAYLEPETGIVAQTGALLVRDNFDAYLLPDSVRDRGVTVRRGKNLASVVVTADESSIVTRIIPVGKDEDGEPLYLGGENYSKKYIERADVQAGFIPNYTMMMAKRIEYDVSVGKPDDENADKVFKTKKEARAELARLAGLEFTENGIDLPIYGMEVDMVLLGNTEEYANFAGLQAVHLYDTVTVIDSVVGINAKVRVTGYKWDVLAGQYESVTLGDLIDAQSTVYSYNLPDAGISGNKIAPNSASGSIIMNGTLNGSTLVPGTVDGAFIRDATIQYAKIDIAAIEQLNAAAISAIEGNFDELLANRITAGMIQAGQITTDKLDAGSITADKIAADAITANKIQAGAIDATHIKSKTITAEQIATGAIMAGDGIISTGAIGTAQIADGSITDAKIVELTASKITAGTINGADVNIINLKADNITTGTLNGKVIPTLGTEKIEDGAITGLKIYNGAITTDKIDDGAVTAAKVVAEAITAEKIAAEAVTTNKIVTGAITAAKLSAGAVTANKIDVGDLFADETVTNALTTSKIFANGDSLEIVAGNVGSGVANIDVQYYLSTSNTSLSGGSWSATAPVWVDGKYMWQRTKTTYKNGTSSYSSATCIAGAKGATGAAGSAGPAGPSGPAGDAGVGVSEVYEQYYLSASKTTQTGGSWVNTAPEWESGKYMWIRTVIVYTDGTSDTTTPFTDTTWELADEAAKLAGEAQDKADAAANAYKDAVSRPEFQRVVRIDTSGMHIGDNLSNCEVLIDSGTVNIVVGGQPYSTFGAGFLQLGDDIRIRRPKTGGVAFCPIKG